MTHEERERLEEIRKDFAETFPNGFDNDDIYTIDPAEFGLLLTLVDKLEAENAINASAAKNGHEKLAKANERIVEFEDIKADLQSKLDLATAALITVAEHCQDGVVVCQTCGDEETLQDVDFMSDVRIALAKLRGEDLGPKNSEGGI